MQVACLIENLAKCTMQSALSAVKNAKYHSSLIPADQSIVETVGQKEDEHVVSVSRHLVKVLFQLFLFSTLRARIYGERLLEDE